MAKTMSLPPLSAPRLFQQDTLIKGQPARIDCIDIGGQTYTITRGPLTVVSLEDEWYDDVRDPEAVIAALKDQSDARIDLFTFWQRLPDLEPKYPYYREWDEIAVLPIKSYDDWLKNQLSGRTRNLIRKAGKEGVVVRETSYDDAFVRGMTAIFNEAPVRQGRPFWNYGKDEATVRRQFSRYIHREHMIGAYYEGEMIGLVMLGNAGRFGLTGQIISSLKHRDKATNNALIAKAVEVCANRGLDHLVYLFWSNDSLSEFKRRCGFERTNAPRYFVPLTATGRLGLKLGAHRGWRAMLPDRVRDPLKRLRAAWYARRES
jgi:hypothetical protein